MSNRESEINSQLALFSRDPRAAMGQQPAKRDAHGKVLTSSVSLFPQTAIATNSFVTQRDQVRKKMCTVRDGVLICLDQILPGKAPYRNNDLAENLVDRLDQPMLRRLEDIEAAKLTSAALKEQPWSDTYWPIYQGMLGMRYGDPKWPFSQNWQINRKYVQAAPLAAIVRSGDQSALDNLSPAEKYDLLLGDLDGSLTEAAWSEGQDYFDQSGAVETWMGICHGWSPAAFMLPRPRKVVELLGGVDGKLKIRFFPSDIKGLGSLLWAIARMPSRFIGGRCNDKKPALDEHGRVTSNDCFDTNPGTWHLAMVNQIGAAQRSFIMDATFDYEVWNQPLYAYAYSYFNPKNQQSVAKLSDAIVSKSAFTEDPFRRYRAARGQSMVGIVMDVTYIAETQPSHAQTDTPEQDRQVAVRYFYDVELDDKGNIIGGEWYLNKHPDFLWTPPPDIRAVTVADNAATGDWNRQGPLPQTWRDAGVAAARNGQPLGKLIAALFDLAQ